MRQRDADLRVDVRDEARSSRSRPGSTPPQTYGMPRYCIAIPTTPPYCDGGGGRDQTASDGVASIEAVKLPAASSAAAARARRGCRAAARRAVRSACVCELRLPAGLLGLELLDLALDPGEHPLALARAGSRSTASGSRARHDPGLLGARAVVSCARRSLTSLRNCLDVAEHLRVLVADALHHVEPAEQVVEVLGAEEDLDRAAAVAVHVQRAQPLGDVRLGGAEALLGDDEVMRVRVRSASIWSSCTFA